MMESDEVMEKGEEIGMEVMMKKIKARKRMVEKVEMMAKMGETIKVKT